MSLVLLCSFAAQAQKDTTDAYIVQYLQQSGYRLETHRAVFWFPAGFDSLRAKSFTAAANKGIEAIENFTGTTFDTAHYGVAKMHYFISNFTTVSHVYNGYAHNNGPRLPYIFFSAKRLQRNALPYLHETTHLILRQFSALWLREGMAEWVATQVGKQLGNGHVAFYGEEQAQNVHALAAGIWQHQSKDLVLAALGNNGVPRFSNAEVRRLFYIASTSFVDYLSTRLQRQQLLDLYNAADTEQALKTFLLAAPDGVRRDWMDFIQKQ